MSNQSEYLKKVILKLERYCAYQDRCEFEVRQKLKNFHVTPEQADHIVDRLIDTSFLDDRRFAESFVNGKLKVKRWGRIKIKSKLIEKRIPSGLINEALSGIDLELYNDIIHELILKKENQLRTKDLSSFEKKQKISQYLLSKGFEWEAFADQF